ncbi:MAG: Rieske (2Fe-2S) protein, partial [Acidimicrobiia bacterium]|nr:Rieske (2Fe-2S) protein [Acidimicrobiia bacterium]
MATDETPSTERPPVPDSDFDWHKVAEVEDLPEGRVKTVTVGRRSLALAHHEGQYGALDNHCPHQGGPLGEGT